MNAVSTVFGRKNNANLPRNEEVIYRSKEITPEQSSLLKRPNFAQYPTVQELSKDKNSKLALKNKELDEKEQIHRLHQDNKTVILDKNKAAMYYIYILKPNPRPDGFEETKQTVSQKSEKITDNNQSTIQERLNSEAIRAK